MRHDIHRLFWVYQLADGQLAHDIRTYCLYDVPDVKTNHCRTGIIRQLTRLPDSRSTFPPEEPEIRSAVIRNNKIPHRQSEIIPLTGRSRNYTCTVVTGRSNVVGRPASSEKYFPVQLGGGGHMRGITSGSETGCKASAGFEEQCPGIWVSFRGREAGPPYFPYIIHPAT